MSGSGREGGVAPLKNAVLIAGPTASGKSGLALAAARRLGGVIINADSMQVYSVLRLLTARPGDQEIAAAPHHLYGHVDPATAYSAGAWLRHVAELADSGELEDRRPIFVGGTGLYFRALLGGLSEMPPIEPAIRQHWRDRLAEEGPRTLHAELARADPEGAERLNPADGPRIVRALEVLESTGRTIGQWRTRAGEPLVDAASAELIVLDPDRGALEARIRARFNAMVRDGALDEVRTLLDLELDPALPAMKAIGVAELVAVLEGRAALADSIERSAVATRQYAKRQATWFRNQMGPEWQRFDTVEGAAGALYR